MGIRYELSSYLSIIWYHRPDIVINHNFVEESGIFDGPLSFQNAHARAGTHLTFILSPSFIIDSNGFGRQDTADYY